MHNCGVIHRDVKPSNCVRYGVTADNKKFKLVDFGLSKSFIVPLSSSLADERYVWDKAWDCAPSSTNISDNNTSSINSSNYNNNQDNISASTNIINPTKRIIGCLRKEREQADFRGTSMYASLRVHQSRDYCHRDDLWGLMYVFCDLLSGGLRWVLKKFITGRRVLNMIIGSKNC